ncbi:hypothetical protein BC941DRAFT_350584 [Chlamydoabsidia padenii]|nr:hypothetical protein BC941DRAFT_350584 [Chlamydoabsidia padenii]
MLTDKYVDKCSEMSILVKFWAPLFESYFCYQKDLFLQWGDTVSLDCKAADLDLRLDLRVVLKSQQEDLEAMTGEAASRQATTSKKLYTDRMKSVIATKCHLNKLLTQMPFLPPRETKLLYMPIIQIMGLDCSIYAMSLVDKQLYAIQKVAQLKYPRTVRELRQGELKKLVQGFECISMMMTDLKATLAEYSRDTRDKMNMAVNGRKKQTTSMMKDWISGVIWEEPEEDDNNDDDGDDDDDNEEDGDDSDE